MLETLDVLDQTLCKAATLDDKVEAAMVSLSAIGFTSLVYDYTPVVRSFEGDLMTPSHLSLRNVPDDMRSLWCDAGYYQKDPVQLMAIRSTTPFIWSYRQTRDKTQLTNFICQDHEPVVSYLHDADLTCGITVPVHRTRGDMATFTAIQKGAGRRFVKEAREHLAVFGLLGQVFHEHAYPLLSEEERRTGKTRLTPRERECLLYSSEGLTAKEIAYKIGRSVPTVILHINSATKKLGARNRLHAVMLASHYRLLDG
ncbi:LuxR family transcriptional regulator [Roseibium sp. AS2]|uniref:helix-turn-helix transcriptional regulator n=1 Tax=Roseibium sp. AS2 TaxID=3135781 RepID=UPI00317E0D13